MKVYVGIGPESEKRVKEEDAFMYAMERVTTVEKDAQDFCNNFTGVRYGKSTPEELKEFREEVVKWFYSDDWVEMEEQDTCQTS